MPSTRLTKINIDKQTYENLKKLAQKYNVSATKMLEILIKPYISKEK